MGRIRSIAACLLLALAGSAGGAGSDTVTVYRCVDAKGRVTLQDDPCPAGTQSSTRQMQRPKDVPAKPATPPATKPLPEPVVERRRAPPPLLAPPPMYRCTSYDGIERYSESYDPNPRCEPMVLYYDPRQLGPELSRACQWVEDSCVRLSDPAACDVWKKKRKEAQSAALHAFSDTATYRKSEVERIGQIVDESCP